MHELPSNGTFIKDGQHAQPEAEGQLSPAYAARIFFKSFEHSQGDPQLQRSFFNLIHNLHREFKMTDDTKAQVLEIAKPRIEKHLQHADDPQNPEKVVFHPQLYVINNVELEMISRLEEMQHAFNYPGEVLPTDSLVFSTGKGIKKQDELHTATPGGRPRRNVDLSDPKNDPQFSYYSYYVIGKNSTGIHEFDEIYELLRQRHQEDLRQAEKRKAELAKMGF